MKTASRKDIKRWFQEGKAQGATHMIVVCDEFSWEDYPVFVSAEEDVQEEYEKWKKKGRVMEVYSLHKNIEAQLNEHRAFHFD